MGIFSSYGIDSNMGGIKADDDRRRNANSYESSPRKLHRLCGGVKTKYRKSRPASSKIIQDSIED